MAQRRRLALFSILLHVYGLVGLAACRTKSKPDESAAARGEIAESPPPSTPTLASPPPPAPPIAGGEFLLVNSAGELVLKSSAGPARVLARSVTRAHYDSGLELVWLEGQELRVVDLRRLDAEPIVIARNWPYTSSFTIDHPASNVGHDETCDVGDMTSLVWDEAPKLKRIEEEVRELPLEALDWLRAELHRPVRATPDEASFRLRREGRRIPLPEGVARCEDPDECGRAVPFGALGVELVLAVTLRGDCWHPYCLFHEPASGAWSSPLRGARWRGAAGNRAGPCGPYAFDRSGKRFLLADHLCGPGEACENIGGTALGWLTPGPVVGAPSDMEMAPEAE